MDTTNPTTLDDARKLGWVQVGEWGDGLGRSGWVVAPADKAEAVRASYDAIDDDDITPTAIRTCVEAGGAFVRD